MTVGFGLIGFGRWGRHHAKAIVEAKDAELVAISAKSEESCRRGEEEFQVQTYPDYRQLLQRPAVDVADIVVPNHLHCSMAVDSLQSGKHVLLEKPMATDIAQCDEILRAVEDTHRLLYVGFELRVSALWGRIKKIVESGEIGRVTHVVIDLWRGPYRAGSEGWRFDEKKVGSWILEEPVHFLDLACWYMEGCGQPCSVYARASSGSGQGEALAENMSFIVNFTDDGYAVVNQTLGGYGHHQTVKVVGTEGALRARWGASVDEALNASSSLEVFDGENVRPVQIGGKAGEAHEIRTEIEEMARAVETGCSTRLASPQEGRRAVVLCRLGEESSKRNTVIDMSPYAKPETA